MPFLALTQLLLPSCLLPLSLRLAPRSANARLTHPLCKTVNSSFCFLLVSTTPPFIRRGLRPTPALGGDGAADRRSGSLFTCGDFHFCLRGGRAEICWYY